MPPVSSKSRRDIGRLFLFRQVPVTITDEKRKLQGRHKAFADAYLGVANGNASEAARIAGYKDPGNEGWRLRKNAEISAYIEERLDAEALSPAEILSELSSVARAEWRDLITIKMRGGDIVDVKMDLRSKVTALELLGKRYKMWTENVEIGAAESFLQALREFGRGDDGASGNA